MRPRECEVLIVGCGPTGVVLANLLGQLGRRVVVLEREREVHPIPRATHIDGETLRNFQTTGLMPRLLPHTTPFGQIDLVDASGRVLLSQKIEEEDDLHGWAESRFFDQPAFERTLRQGLERYANVEVHLGVEVQDIAPGSAGVTVHARSVPDGAPLTFHAGWVVGCDGGRSRIRKALGDEMEALAPRRHWIIVDALLRHADTARLLPDRFTYRLDPERLTIYAHGIGLNRRWEFQLGREEPIPEDAEVLRWVAKYVELSRIEVTRIANYAHNSLVARRWRVGRVLLAGDAAHMMPPSAGQGLCSGIRDAVNLAWKLDLAVTTAGAGALLDTYEQERRPHVCAVLQGTRFISHRLQGDTPLQRWWRRLWLGAIGALPWLQAAARRSARRRPPLRYGFLDRHSCYFGRHLPQLRVVRPSGEEVLLDDLLGYQLALITRPDVLDRDDVAWAAQRGLRIWRLGADFTEIGNSLARWWTTHRLDFALVRPDHHVFGCGTRRDLARLKDAFDRWWQP